MDNIDTSLTVVSSLFWKLFERGSTSGVQFIVQIVLARLLVPENFGTVAIVTVFITFATIFVEGGFNMSLVQKKDSDNKDFSSVLYLSFGVALILYLLIFFLSPSIGKFYDNSEISAILRVLSLNLFIGAFNSIQNAYVSKHMMFKKLFFSSFISSVLSGIVGIGAAYMGIGVWALVLQQLTSRIVVSIVLWFTVKWRPIVFFSTKRIGKLFSYGWKLLAGNILHNLFNNIRTLAVGKIDDPTALAYYNRGESFPSLIVSNIDGSIQSVLFPAFSHHQEDKERLKNMVRRSIVTSSFLIFPAMIGLAVVAEPLVKILLTDKWLPAVFYIQIFCVSNLFRPMQGVNLQIINALGRSDINLKLQFLKRGIEFAVLLICLPFGIKAIAIGAALTPISSTVINSFPNKKLLGYSFGEQLIDVLPTFILSLIMGISIFFFSYLDINVHVLLSIQLIIGVIVYFALARIVKLDSLKYAIDAFKNLLSPAKGAKN